jgi:lipoprotein-releasing system permease protein
MWQLLFKSWEALLSVRFLLGKKSINYISFTSWSSIIAMQLGIMTLIIVLSVMNGFRALIEQIYVSVDAEIQVTADETLIQDWAAIAKQIANVRQVVATAAWLERQGLMLSGQSANPLLVRGVLPAQEKRIVQFGKNNTPNDFDVLQRASRNVIVGNILAQEFGLTVGSKISLMLPKSGQGSAFAAPDVGNFVVAGIFSTRDSRSNQNMIYMNLYDLQQFIAVSPATLTGLQVKTANMEQAPEVANEIRRNVSTGVRVLDWQQKNATQYKAIKFEKLLMTIMLGMIVLISGFNIVTSTVMTVNAKKAEIAILMTMGANSASIARIFFFNGVLLGIGGVIFGVGSGVLLAPNIGDILAHLENWFGFRVFDPAGLDIVHIPSRLEWHDVGVVAVLSFATALLSTVYPALRAARVEPAQALRYE